MKNECVEPSTSSPQTKIGSKCRKLTKPISRQISGECEDLHVPHHSDQELTLSIPSLAYSDNSRPCNNHRTKLRETGNRLTLNPEQTKHSPGDGTKVVQHTKPNKLADCVQCSEGRKYVQTEPPNDISKPAGACHLSGINTADLELSDYKIDGTEMEVLGEPQMSRCPDYPEYYDV